MLALAAIPMGVEICSLDPTGAAPAGAVSELVVGGLDDVVAVARTAAGASVVTYEWEGVPATSTRHLETHGSVVRPSTRALEVSQDRAVEKTTFTALQIPVAPWAAVDARDGLDSALARIGSPAILKTRRGGYDGKGQAIIDSPDAADAAWTDLGPAGELVLEGMVDFERELSIIAVRSVDGEVRSWPLIENQHRGGILRVSRAPALRVTPELQELADGYASAVLHHFDYVGVLTIELFQVGDALIANEMAPRVHNSGHWTIEGAATSQFENHVRAVLGWPLGRTAAIGASAMINCIGHIPEPIDLLGIEGVHVHAYGKSARPGRKVGHVTVTADSVADLEPRLAAALAALPADDG
ncbi:MAG: 5-(carboxyamino)imidazole ribonucleotide synthase [Acidimicrobiia bacterium]|nr:5-(carboxyamino)imidazole ribonucleotide synthase [Acidimicrobiia bacterium]